MKRFLLISLLAALIPGYALADNSTSTLNNQSDSKTGYYLVQDWIWGNQGCVIAPTVGMTKIQPGQSAQLTVKEGCKWGGVRYKIFNVANNQEIGSLSHSFHNGSFSIDVSAPCSGSTCVFRDLDPQQNRDNSNKG